MNEEEKDLSEAKLRRKEAEKMLKIKQKDKQILAEDADARKLLHELQVHQIELEMQNEELREAWKTAETALKKFTMLYDFAPTGYFTLDSDGSILDLNFTGAELLGDKRFNLIGSTFKLFVSDLSRPIFNRFLEKIYETNAKEVCELMLGYDDNPLCYVYMDGVTTGDDRNCLLSAFDISKFRK